MKSVLRDRTDARVMSAFVNSPPALVVDRPAPRDACIPAVTSAQSCLARLRDACREEICRLARIVRELSCHALLRGTAGSVIPLSTPGDPGIAAPISCEPTVSSPIHECGRIPGRGVRQGVEVDWGARHRIEINPQHTYFPDLRDRDVRLGQPSLLGEILCHCSR
jgi:hypothetical protein